MRGLYHVHMISPPTPKRRGLSRIWHATRYSLSGLRAGWRRYGGPSGNEVLNRQLGFAELHALF